VAVLRTDGDTVASSDLTAFHDIVLIRAGPFCPGPGGDGRHALAVYAQRGSNGGPAMFLVHAADGRTIHQERLGPAIGARMFLDRTVESVTPIVDHGGVVSYRCVIEGAWGDL
jgi:hypothetical protein